MQPVAPQLPADGPVFSREEFDRATLGDSGLQRELIEAFLKEAATCRAELVGLARSGPDLFMHAVHRLKGSCHYTAGLRLLSVLESVPQRFNVDHAQGRVQAAGCIIQELDQLESSLAGMLDKLKDV